MAKTARDGVVDKAAPQISAFIPERFKPSLMQLLTAADYAADSHADRWQFAIELSALISGGATLADIRWLELRGFAEHAKETTVPGDLQRSFRPLAPTAFPPDTCVVLSPSGASALRSAITNGLAALSAPAAESVVAPSQVEERGPVAKRPKPKWDRDHRELRYNGQVVKRYRVPAHNQELILAAFEEEGWPDFIDDPLPPADEHNPKHRLQVTIKSLNRNQLVTLIRFHGNGNGLQIHWQTVAGG